MFLGSLDGQTVAALAIFLFFHKLRSWVNAAVENVFFSSWKARDSALRYFVKRAVHITEIKPLVLATIEQLDQFAAPASSALYRMGDDGHYHRLGASLALAPATIDINEPAAVTLRCDGSPLSIQQIGTLSLEALAIPMMYRGRLDGFVLLHRPDGQEAIRPDQVTLLAEVVREIGLDMAALEIDQHKRLSQELEQENRALRSHAAELRAILAEAAAQKAAG